MFVVVECCLVVVVECSLLCACKKGAKCYRNLHLNELFLNFFKFSVPVGYSRNRTEFPETETEFPEPEIGTDRFQFLDNRITRGTEYLNRSVSDTRMPRVNVGCGGGMVGNRDCSRARTSRPVPMRPCGLATDKTARQLQHIARLQQRQRLARWHRR
jgi:hypothetical protein